MRFLKKSRAVQCLFSVLLCGTLCYLTISLSSSEESAEKKADPSRMTEIVRQLTEGPSRRYDNVEGTIAARDLIARHFKEAGLSVEIQQYTARGVKQYNVIGIKRGKNRTRVVAGAHYDSYDDTPGANDNASGVAALIECAYLLKTVPEPECDIEFVAFGSQKPPIFLTEEMGSFVHAKRLHEQKISVAMMFCLDEVGFYTDEPDTQTYPVKGLSMVYGSKANFLALFAPMRDFSKMKTAKRAFANTGNLRVLSMNVPMSDNSSGLANSDHASYMKFNFPVILLSDTTYFRNERHHTERDTWDSLDYTRLALVADGLAHAVCEIGKP